MAPIRPGPDWFHNLLDLKKRILSLPRVGEETADVLLAFLFGKRTVIEDEYQSRIAYGHGVIGKEGYSKNKLKGMLSPYLSASWESRRFHARVDEIGVLFCSKAEPGCARCPLETFPRRI